MSGEGMNGSELMEKIAPCVRGRSVNDLKIYLHVPFCTSKCHFCDWVAGIPTSELVKRGPRLQDYADALCEQISWYGPRLMELGYKPRFVYWGGGTPTRLTPEQFGQIGECLKRSFDLTELVEYTVEASPETVTAEQLGVLREVGLNRVSIGVQSLAERVLRRMGRAHGVEQALQAMEMVRKSGIEHFNIDLIVDFPEQTFEEQVDSVTRAIELQVPHLTVYPFREVQDGLVAVRQVRAGHRDDANLQAQARARVHQGVAELLHSAGYREPLRGFFAREPRFEVRSEELTFGMRGDFIGFGTGAYSRVGRHALQCGPGPNQIDIEGFIRDPLRFDTVRPLAALPPEWFVYGGFLVQALLTRTGIDFDLWESHVGLDLRALRERPLFADHFRMLEQRYGIRCVQTDERIQVEGGLGLGKVAGVEEVMWGYLPE
jgi:coproporphyrinogen III oxidase-like Fe-S oxidoreductase